MRRHARTWLLRCSKEGNERALASGEKESKEKCRRATERASDDDEPSESLNFVSALRPRSVFLFFFYYQQTLSLAKRRLLLCSFLLSEQTHTHAVPLARMLALNSSGRAAVAAAAATKAPSSKAPAIRRRRSSPAAIVSASAEPQDFNYASPRPYSSPEAGDDLTPYFGKVHANDASKDAKPANTIHAW